MIFRPDARSGDIGRSAGAIEATLSQSPTGMDCSVKSNLAALTCGRWSQLMTVTLQIRADRKLPHSSRPVQLPRRSALRRRRAAANKSPANPTIGFAVPQTDGVDGPCPFEAAAERRAIRRVSLETRRYRVPQTSSRRPSSKRRRPCQHAIAGDKSRRRSEKSRGWRSKPRHHVQRTITTTSRRHREPDQTAGREGSYRRSWCSPA